MPSLLIENTLTGLDAALLTDIFLFILFAVFISSYILKRRHKHQLFTGYTPTLLTSLGILGTFAGIIVGLLGFNTADIDASIGPLLEGLKTAFISSLAGMLLSIAYKIGVTTGFLIPAANDLVDDDDVGSVDFYKVMKQQVDSLDQLKRSIAGEDESSLIGVLKLQKSDAADHQKNTRQHLEIFGKTITEIRDQNKARDQAFERFQAQLWQEFKDFSDMLSKSATEQVIEALKQVIQDFNNNLIEQFGDNFKALNEAVLKLVEWQENYKSQLADMQKKYALGVQAISQTEVSVAHISNEAKVIPQAMLELRNVVEVNQHQISELDRHLLAFSEVRDKAVAAVPEIQSQIDQAIRGAQAANDTLAQGMQASAERMHTILAEGSEEFKNNVAQTNAALTEASQTTASSSEEIKINLTTAIDDINNHMRSLLSELESGGKELNSQFKSAGDGLVKQTDRWASEFAQALADSSTKLETTIEQQARNHAEQANKVFSGLERTIESALANTGESVQKQVDMIDRTASAEIEKVMNSMGSALASIANQFVQDYSQLVAQMNTIVRQQR